MPSLPVESALTLTSKYGTHECRAWREKIFIRYQSIAHHLARRYSTIAEVEGYVEANRWLLGIYKELKLGGTGLKLTDSVDRITDYARAKSKKNLRQIHEIVDRVGKHMAPPLIRAMVERIGIDFPLGNDYTPDQWIAALARVCDEKWLKRQLKDKQWRELEDFLRRNHSVCRDREMYVSKESYYRRRTQLRENQKLLERIEADNQEGQVYTLAELQELSPSNPVIRRHELMVRMAGFQQFAEASTVDYVGVFYTVTCPSAYHATSPTGESNPNFNCSTAREAQGYLNTVWQRTRAALDRADIRPFGFRVAEPHHDGTPHWHILVFVEASKASKTTEILRHYALEKDGDEPGAAKHRLKVVKIDPSKGSAAGYIAKYIAKNIDGEGVELDHYGRDAIVSALRIDAWKAVHGIRQFQQIGGASVTVYRELRRLENSAVDTSLLQELIKAADKADWAAYNDLMGGVICPRKERPARPMMIERESKNQYGEAVAVLKGIWCLAKAICTRPYEWIIRTRPEIEVIAEAEDGVGFGAALSTAPPGAGAPLEFCQ